MSAIARFVGPLRYLAAAAFGAACVAFRLEPVEVALGVLYLLPPETPARHHRFAAASLGALLAALAFAGGVPAAPDLAGRARHEALLERGPWLPAVLAGWTAPAVRDEAALYAESAGGAALGDATVPVALVVRLLAAAVLFDLAGRRAGVRWSLRAAGILWGVIFVRRLLA